MAQFDVIVIGAGAAGLMCALTAGNYGKKIAIVEHTGKIGEKIRISGGGRCNFTNLHTSPANFLSQNPSFCISALKRYTQNDFINLVKKHHISYHEKTLGQLFCDQSSNQIIKMLTDECDKNNVHIMLQHAVENIAKVGDFFELIINGGKYAAKSLVIATGGLSVPKIGASDFGYRIAKQFGHGVVKTYPALVPLTLDSKGLQKILPLAGVSQDCIAKFQKTGFREAMLFTHRGVSGPAILQISSYWDGVGDIIIDFLPSQNCFDLLMLEKENKPKQQIYNVLSDFMPKKLSEYIVSESGVIGSLADLSKDKIKRLSDFVHGFKIKPNGTEGFAKAEVTIGGVDTLEVSSKTMESRIVQNLYFIGEVLDITGHLGGFNFQWAWSSGFAAGTAIGNR